MQNLLHFFGSLLVLIIVVMAMAACGGTNSRLNDQLADSGEPFWVLQGSSTVKNAEYRTFYGVAWAELASNVNVSVQASIADKKAKAELVLQLERYMEVISRDFIASGEVEHEVFSHVEAKEQIAKLAQASAPWMGVAAHWVSPNKKRLYAIAQLSLPKFKVKVNQVLVSRQFERYLHRHAESVFDRVARNPL